MKMPGIIGDVAAAFQFLTRLPLSHLTYTPNTLSRSAKFFPLVGLAVGSVAAALHHWLLPHLPVAVVALVVVLFSTLVTGGLHEDGLADAADGFGGGWSREQILEILKDSRIGSYGALAIVFSIGARVLLLSSFSSSKFAWYVISAHVLCRWSVLPLGHLLSAARKQASQGARLARQISWASLLVGALIAFGIVAYLLRMAAFGPIIAVSTITLLSGIYYQRRIGGVTGDCFGATIQLAEISVYVCGVWQS